MPAITPEDPLYPVVINVLGGWFIGGSLVLLLEGILICQVNNYYTWYKEDKLLLKIAVGILFIFTLLKTIQAFAINYIHNVLYIKAPAEAVKLSSEWFELVNIPLGAIIGTYVQTYYSYRLFKLSGGRWWVVGPILAVMTLGMISAIITASLLAKTGNSSDWFAIHTSCTFATDILITATSTFFLLVAKKDALKNSRKLIDSLIKLCFQTALPASVATLIQLICSRLGSKQLLPQPANAIILVLLHISPIIYANCMLYILNTRRSIRLGDTSNGLGNTITHPSRTRTGTRRPGEMELGVLSGIQVQTETTRNVTVSDFDLDQDLDKKPGTRSLPDDDSSIGRKEEILNTFNKR